MEECFDQLFKSANQKVYRENDLINAEVLEITKDYVILKSSLKSESYVPVEQFIKEDGETEALVGENIELVIDELDNGFGESKLSREKARKMRNWLELYHKFEHKEAALGKILNKVKSGFIVNLGSLNGFLPGSLADVHTIRNYEEQGDQMLEFFIIKLDQRKNNIVLSRKAFLESAGMLDSSAVLDNIVEGQKLKGTVKHLASYGAFVDIGNGVDALLHVSDIAWAKKTVEESLKLGDIIEVMVIKVDRAAGRVSIGLKQMVDDPWLKVEEKYTTGESFKGTVTNVMQYGCFVKLEEGIEGLVHVSEMSWTDEYVTPSQVVYSGMEVQVSILDINIEKRRIALSLRSCQENPFHIFGVTHKAGNHIQAVIKSIAELGIVLDVGSRLEGLIRYSDMQDMSYEKAAETYNKGDTLECKILSIDPEKKEIFLKDL